MSRNVAQRLKLNKLLRPPAASQPKRTLHASTSSHFAATLGSVVDQAATPPAVPRMSAVERLRRRKAQDLEVLLARDGSTPAEVWGMYVDLLTMVDPQDVPLETHQRVLRKSTLSPAASRANLYRRMEMKRRPRVPHIHEVRYQTIINNMIEGGHTPQAEDYHFILEQFAAVGHHVGALQVLQEMTHHRLPTTHRTYGLCLMAICHRLSLPVWHQEKARMVEAMSQICHKLVNDMWTEKIQVTAFNVDLTLRVLKETMDYDAFEKLLRMAYGIDLSFPDRPPLEFWDRPRDGDASESDVWSPPVQQPFSTSALNTTLDFLGRSGNVSKLIQAFEVLTTPLPSPTIASPDSAYADDADEDFGINEPGVAPYTAPYAEPNTTSFSLLIKWLSRHGRPSLARHYVVHVMEQDRLVDRHLRGECILKKKGEILAPHLGLTQYMFLPILGEANRDGNVEMLRFILRKIRRALRRKRFDIDFYSDVQRQWDAQVRQAAEDAVEAAVASHSAEAPATPSFQAPTATATKTYPASFPSDTLIQVPYEQVPEPRTPSGPPLKLFDVNLHLSILRRDLFHLEELEKRAMDTLGRKAQRLKEKLGRRIWADRDVYMSSQGRRVRISRPFWREKVHFSGTRALPARELQPRMRRRETQVHVQPGSVAAQRGFFTPSSPWAERLRRRPQQQQQQQAPAKPPS
ncbi:hypothetical protein PHLGIDRAFT_136362 [Phlebiopsis gigantea 11061_1 CR5-6]|uniref:Uncharacterized protein n=1 Tax=Phlebiopsis gigantea (strain 11061_1 CR5-6) TaxID=745531 RepID=A0A0C3SEK7_PHLG1|nr:hypothetical protein PHLGIDRAFT_136362 [Phlebiopsis gigantea 11061_1 CR5-6]